MKRNDGREANELRPVQFEAGYLDLPLGSVLVHLGNTIVLCNASVDARAPRWMEQQRVEGGWVTAEYAMLPQSTPDRTPRETRGLGGRTQEIRRLIGRSLRAAVDLKLLGAKTVIVDCDVLQADGGTRTAAITGGYLAMEIALRRLIEAGEIEPAVLVTPIAAVSVGVVDGNVLLDLPYAEDSIAQVDANVVMNERGAFVEVQGTGEGAVFSREELESMLDLAEKGIHELLAAGRVALDAYLATR